MKNFKLILSYILITTFIIGCAIKNTGATDFRRTTGTDNNLSIKHYSLSDKNNTISVGSFLSIHLKTVFIKDFHEKLDFDSLIGKNEKNGEIAILANAVEMGNTSVTTIDFSSNDNEKVIYYSDDIEEGQFLNFYNLPIYGPKEYKGGSILLKLSIVELDVIRESTKKAISYVTKLAIGSISTSESFADVISNMSQLLLKGDKNDVTFEYILSLDQNKKSNGVRHFALESGNYIFIREENRKVDTNWKKIFFNNKNGRLYTEKNCTNLYRDNSYIVIEVNENVSFIESKINHLTYKALTTKLTKDDLFESEEYNKTKNDFNKILKKEVESQNYKKAIYMIEEIKGTQDNNKTYFIKRRNLEKIADLIDKNSTNETPSLSKNGKELVVQQLIQIFPKDINVTSYNYFKESNMSNNITNILGLWEN